MELLISVFFLAGAVFFALKLGNSDESTGQPQRTPQSQQAPKRRSPKPLRKVETSRFDEKNAKHLHRERTLTGAAYVIDGDTIKIKHRHIRLYGIDAPELNHPHGKNAKWALHKLCNGHTIRAEITVEDDYGRAVARCYFSDGRDLSAEMVKLGLAIDWPKFSGGRYKNLELPDARRKLFLADARQKGRIRVWKEFEAQQAKQ